MARPRASGSPMDRLLERDVCELVQRVTGLRDQADPNFRLALDFVWSNFRIYEKFTIHSDLGKAASWKRLTTEFLNSSLPCVEKTKVSLQACALCTVFILSMLCSFSAVPLLPAQYLFQTSCFSSIP
ncbi:hypothetical protein LEMLEM_LOCUS16621 [Lemmus lemmus]